jgi:hypothetical protein
MVNMQNMMLLTIAKPWDHRKLIGHYILLLIRGLKPHIDFSKMQMQILYFDFMLHLLKQLLCHL